MLITIKIFGIIKVRFVVTLSIVSQLAVRSIATLTVLQLTFVTKSNNNIIFIIK